VQTASFEDGGSVMSKRCLLGFHGAGPQMLTARSLFVLWCKADANKSKTLNDGSSAGMTETSGQRKTKVSIRRLLVE
jgi:hypothetical protein